MADAGAKGTIVPCENGRQGQQHRFHVSLLRNQRFCIFLSRARFKLQQIRIGSIAYFCRLLPQRTECNNHNIVTVVNLSSLPDSEGLQRTEESIL